MFCELLDSWKPCDCCEGYRVVLVGESDTPVFQYLDSFQDENDKTKPIWKNMPSDHMSMEILLDRLVELNKSLHKRKRGNKS